MDVESKRKSSMNWTEDLFHWERIISFMAHLTLIQQFLLRLLLHFFFFSTYKNCLGNNPSTFSNIIPRSFTPIPLFFFQNKIHHFILTRCFVIKYWGIELKFRRHNQYQIPPCPPLKLIPQTLWQTKIQQRLSSPLNFLPSSSMSSSVHQGFSSFFSLAFLCNKSAIYLVCCIQFAVRRILGNSTRKFSRVYWWLNN